MVSNVFRQAVSVYRVLFFLLLTQLFLLSNAMAVDLTVGISERDWEQIHQQILATERISDGELVSDVMEKGQEARTTNPTILQSDYIKASNTDAGDIFGFDLALSGSTLVVGARSDDSDGAGADGNPTNNTLTNSGAVYVFVQNEAGWVQQAYLKASNPGLGDEFGRAVDIHGDTIVVGAVFEDSSTAGVNSVPNEGANNSGAAYIFTRSDGEWTQEAYLKASNPSTGDYFGESVSIYGDTVVVGARFEDSSTTGVNPGANSSATDTGAVYVFVREDGEWVQQAFIKASNAGNSDQFGFDISLWEDTLAVSNHADDSGSNVINGSQSDSTTGSNYGSVFIFQRTNNLWVQQAYVKSINPDDNDQFGVSVSISGDYLVVGSHLEDSSAVNVGGNPFNNNADRSGAVYVYKRNANGNWRYLEYLKASNTGAGDEFGRNVEVTGTFIVVGAHVEDGSGQAVNGMPDNDFSDAGAAYLYSIETDTVRPLSYLKASNAGVDDRFGFPVAVSGTSIAVGAFNEDSNSEGINGDPNNDAAINAGAAYIFNQASSFHPLGGTVLGLAAGNSIQLQNNGGDQITISENGQFRFAPLYTSGNTYTVTVNSDATNPHQDCVLTNAEGVVDESSYESILVDCTLSTLSIQDKINTVESAIVTVPIQLAPEGLSLASVSFSIDYDPACLNPDRDADGNLDNIVFSVPADFTASVSFDPLDENGEINISIADITAPLSTLGAGNIATIDFFVDCPAAQPFVQSSIAFGTSPEPGFGDLGAQNVAGTVDHGSVRVWDGVTGDCNVNGAVDGVDMSAIALEVVDADGDNYLDAPASDFFGSPQGCDANGNEIISVADAACINNIINGDACVSLRTTGSDAKPELNVSLETEQDIVWLQHRLFQNQTPVAGVSYRLELDLNEFDTSLLDLDRDTYVDERNIRFAQGQPGVYSIRWSQEGDLGYLDILLLDSAQNQLAEGLVLEVGIPTAQIPDGGLVFSEQRRAVFASTSGVDIEGVYSIGDLIHQNSFE